MALLSAEIVCLGLFASLAVVFFAALCSWVLLLRKSEKRYLLKQREVTQWQGYLFLFASLSIF